MNAIGAYIGQHGRWTFRTEEEAEQFRAYADSKGKDEVTALDVESLKAAGIPLPVKMEE